MNLSLRSLFFLFQIFVIAGVGHTETVRVLDSDIQNDAYVFSVPFEADDAILNEMILSDATELVSRQEEGGAKYITPNAQASFAELNIVFDFSQSSYLVEFVSVRDTFNFFVRPDLPSDAIVKAVLEWDGNNKEDLWGVICQKQSRHEQPFQSAIDVNEAKKVTYRLTMEVLGNDAGGSFGDATFQWNRLNSPDDNDERAFRIEFKLKKAR